MHHPAARNEKVSRDNGNAGSFKGHLLHNSTFVLPGPAFPNDLLVTTAISDSTVFNTSCMGRCIWPRLSKVKFLLVVESHEL